MRNICIFLLLSLFMSACATNKDAESERLYWLLQIIADIENSRSYDQSKIHVISDLNGTVWVKEIPDTYEFNTNDGFIFFGNTVLVFEMQTTDSVPELPIASVQKYTHNFYKVRWGTKYKTIDDTHLEIFEGLISFYIAETYLYVCFDGGDYEKYCLHSVFDVWY